MRRITRIVSGTLRSGSRNACACSTARRAENITALEERNRQLAAFLEERKTFLQRVKKAVEELKSEERRLREQ